MKKYLTIALTLIVLVSLAQEKKENRISLKGNFVGAGMIKPLGFVINGSGAERPMLTVEYPKNGWNNPIDSIIIHLKKKKLHWINDSTAVIAK